MSASLPPELLTPEDREARAAELEWRISHEWVRFAITEAVLIWLPVTVVILLYVAGTISYRPMIVLAVGISALSIPLVVFWILVRIRPLSSELGALRSAR